MCKEHFKHLSTEKGNSTAMNLMRKHFSNYLKGFPNASIFRQKLVTANSYEKMILGLEEFDRYAKKGSL